MGTAFLYGSIRTWAKVWTELVLTLWEQCMTNIHTKDLPVLHLILEEIQIRIALA